MQLLGRAPLAAAVSRAGGLGLLTAGCFDSVEEFEEELALLRRWTDGKPFGINISIGIRNNMEVFVDSVCRQQVPIVFTSGRNPEKFVDRLKSHGIIVVHVVPAVRYALTAQRLGVDAVVMVGFEAGGHPGMDDVGLMALLPRAVDALDIPVIAAGGITDARGIVAALALGAEGVQMGTRFMMTQECKLHEKVKRQLLSAKETDTLMISRSIRKAHRVYHNEPAEKVLALEKEGRPVEDLLPIIGREASRATILEGDLSRGVVSLGQGIGSIDDIPTVEALFHRWANELKTVFQRLDAMRHGQSQM